MAAGSFDAAEVEQIGIVSGGMLKAKLDAGHKGFFILGSNGPGSLAAALKTGLFVIEVELDVSI